MVKLRLIKNSSDKNTIPELCNSCQSKDFLKSGFGWYCSKCGYYVPFKVQSKVDFMKSEFDKLKNIQKGLKELIKEMEEELK